MQWRCKATTVTVDILNEFEVAIKSKFDEGSIVKDKFMDYLDDDSFLNMFELMYTMTSTRGSDYPTVLEYEEVEPKVGEPFRRSKISRILNGSFGWMDVSG